MIRLVSRNGGTQLPVTLAEMLEWIKRGDTDEDDDLILGCLMAAIRVAENFTGLICVDSTFDYYADDFPAKGGPIYLQRGPLLEVQSVNYRYTSETTLASSGYLINTSDSSLYLPASGTWPTTDGAGNAVRVRFRAGFIEMTGSPSPDGSLQEDFKMAIQMIAAKFYENREDDPKMANPSRVPYGAELILRQYRILDSIA